ncbi:MAG: hypothetical protein HQM14_14345 [SAR324 cluster bacterium]|nr:hypothetical protein [SAR324 cluster bacterium]
MGFSMTMWLLACMGLGTLMYFWNKKKSEKTEQVGTAEEFSNFTLYFDPIRGEGHLFVGGTLVIITFSLFCHELAKILTGIILGI